MGRFDLFFFNVLAPAFAVMMLFLGTQDLGPAWRARWGHGRQGVFTALYEYCEKSCSWSGNFTADDGQVRRNVTLGTGHGPSHAGDEVAAVDTDARIDVYPLGGGHDWLDLSGLTLVPLAYLIGWGRVVWRWRRRRRR